MPELSVVIPAYGRHLETARAVRSALDQNGVDLEIVVVDDATPDPIALPPELTATDRIRLVRLRENRGPAAARNAGVGASSGRYIAFLDSDDLFVPDTLASRLAFLKANGAGDEPVLSCCGVWRWSPGRGATWSMPMAASRLISLASGCWYFPGSTALFTRETWQAVGPLDERLRRLEDLDWGIRLARAGGRLAVAPLLGTVVTRSLPAGSSTVRSAAAHLLGRYGPGGADPLPGPAFRSLRAYLDLELANAARGEKRPGALFATLLSSFFRVPRTTLHLGRWWIERPASRGEVAMVEGYAARASMPRGIMTGA